MNVSKNRIFINIWSSTSRSPGLRFAINHEGTVRLGRTFNVVHHEVKLKLKLSEFSIRARSIFCLWNRADIEVEVLNISLNWRYRYMGLHKNDMLQKVTIEGFKYQNWSYFVENVDKISRRQIKSAEYREVVSYMRYGKTWQCSETWGIIHYEFKTNTFDIVV